MMTHKKCSLHYLLFFLSSLAFICLTSSSTPTTTQQTEELLQPQHIQSLEDLPPLPTNPSFTITQPNCGTNGGNAWIEANTYDIVWVYNNTNNGRVVNYVSLDLIRPNDAGGSHNLGTTNNNGSIAVTMSPRLFLSSQGIYKDWVIRIADVVDPTNYALSCNFTIIVPVVTYGTVAPTWWVGDIVDVVWSTNSLSVVPNINIYLQCSNGSSYTLGLNTPNTGIYSFPSLSTPFDPTSNNTYTFQICWPQNPTICWSTPSFIVSEPWIEVNISGTPQTGGVLEFYWRSAVGYNNTYLVSNNITAKLVWEGQYLLNMPVLCTSAQSTINSYPSCSVYPLPFWLQGGGLQKWYQVEVSWNKIPSAVGRSDYFAIAETINVNFYAGNVVVIGASYTFDWYTVNLGMDSFSLALYATDSYATDSYVMGAAATKVQDITVQLPQLSTNGTYTWQPTGVNASLTQLYYLQVSYPYTQVPYSNTPPFMIISPKMLAPITMTSPATDTWQVESTYTIEWAPSYTQNQQSNVILPLVIVTVAYPNGNIVSTSTPMQNTGSYTWKVPDGVSAGSNFVVSVCYITLPNNDVITSMCGTTNTLTIESKPLIDIHVPLLAYYIAIPIGVVLLLVVGALLYRRFGGKKHEYSPIGRTKPKIWKFFLVIFLLLCMALGIYCALVATHVIKCLPSTLKIGFWQCPVDNLLISSSGTANIGQPSTFTANINPVVYGVKYEWTFSDNPLTPVSSGSSNSIDYVFSGNQSIDSYSVTVKAYTSRYSSTATYTIPVVYQLGNKTKMLDASDIVTCTNTTVTLTTVAVTRLNISVGDVVVANGCEQSGGLMHFVTAITHPTTTTTMLTLNEADITDAVANMYLQNTTIDFSAANDDSDSSDDVMTRKRDVKDTTPLGIDYNLKPLIAKWAPQNGKWAKTFNPQVTLNLQPSISFEPTFQLNTKIVAHILVYVQVSFSATLTVTLDATLTVTGSVDESDEAKDVYTKEFKSFWFVVPGLDLPLYITPEFSVDIGVSAKAEATIQLESSISLSTTVSGSVSWGAIQGFSANGGAAFNPTFTPPHFTIACAQYSLDVYVVPTVTFSIYHFLDITVAPTPHMWGDRMFPPPINEFHGSDVDCLCSTADPNSPKHGYSAISAGLVTELGLELPDLGLKSSTEVPLEKVLDDDCWVSTCGPCYCPAPTPSPLLLAPSTLTTTTQTQPSITPPLPPIKQSNLHHESGMVGTYINHTSDPTRNGHVYPHSARNVEGSSNCNWYNPCQDNGMYSCCSSSNILISRWACCCLTPTGTCCGNNIYYDWNQETCVGGLCCDQGSQCCAADSNNPYCCPTGQTCCGGGCCPSGDYFCAAGQCVPCTPRD